METRANYVAVGIFTLVALLGAFFFVYWTAQYGGTEATATIEVRIPGSAAGLGRGSQVLFNGVRIGDVRNVNFDPADPRVAVAEAVVVRSAPITASTRASIGVQGLTGQAYIEFSGGDPTQPSIFEAADAAGTVATVTADPSAVANILETVQSIAVRADRILDGLESVVQDARDPLTQSMKNIQKFSQALSDNSDQVDDFLKNFTSLSEQLGTASGKLGTTLDSASELMKAIDRDKINDTIANIQSFTDRLDNSTQNIDEIVAGVDKALKNIETFAGSATKTADRIEKLLADVDSGKVKTTMDNIAAASENAKSVAEEAKKLADRVGARGDDIEVTIRNARELSEKLNAASTRIDGVLAKLDGLLGDEGGSDLIADARETLNSFKSVADNLNTRIDRISGGLEKFSGRGLDEVQNLVQDSRRSIQRIERAITDLERNPQRIISGGAGTVRQYDGRARR